MWRWILDEVSHLDVMGVAGLIVGVVGSAFGLRQYLDQRETAKQLQAAELHLKEIMEKLKNSEIKAASSHDTLQLANKKLAEIADKTLTIATSRFPFNLNALVKFIDEAAQELAITCDFLGYAIYSNTPAFLDYFAALERAFKRNVKIRFLLYGLDTGRQAVGKQLPPGNYGMEREKARCREYFRLRHGGGSPPTSYNEFRDTLLRDEEELITKLDGVELKVIDHSLLTFAWIADQTEGCIFAFRNDGRDEAGLTFLSRDKHIVTEFRALFDAEWDKASDPLYKSRW